MLTLYRRDAEYTCTQFQFTSTPNAHEIRKKHVRRSLLPIKQQNTVTGKHIRTHRFQKQEQTK